MRGLSIALGLRLALIGLTLVLALIAVLGVASLYGARQDYEAELSRAYELEATSSRLLAAGIVEQTAALSGGTEARRNSERAMRIFDREAAAARELAEPDRRSEALLADRIAVQERIRRLADGGNGATRRREAAAREARMLGEALAARQDERRAEARDEASAETRRAALTIIMALLLALAAALLLVRDLLTRVRRPLGQLVGATRRVAAGDLSRPVTSEGPAELREVGDAFNAMASDLRDARSRLEDERRKLEVTIESLGDGLVVCDADGIVTAFNPRARALLLGIQVGRPAGPDGGGPLPPVEEALEGEAIMERGDQMLAVTAAPLEARAGGTVWTIRDISERVRLERMKSDFVAAVSHELRSPLTSIKGFIELLGHSQGLTAKQRDSVEVIRISTDRLVDLVEDLLEVARIDAGRVALEPRPIDLAEVIGQVVSLIAPRLTEKDQRFEVHCPSDLPPAYADPGRMQEVVENLITNAHLYTDVGGTVAVRCRAVDREVEIEVADSGRGMTPEEVEHAFDRFYRGGAEASVSPGTGLGLWIVRSLVELQGGWIALESTPGKGSIFTVRLPGSEPGQSPRAESGHEDSPAAAGS